MARDLFLSAAQHSLPVSCHRPGPFFGLFSDHSPGLSVLLRFLTTTFFDEGASDARRVKSIDHGSSMGWFSFYSISGV